MRPDRRRKLKQLLEQAQENFLASQEMRADAIEPALRYTNWHDKEFSAFLCSVLAYGRVEHIKSSIHRVLDPMGANPHRWLLEASDGSFEKLVTGWSHRFNTASDMNTLLRILRSVYRAHGSLETLAPLSKNLPAVHLLEGFVESFVGVATREKIQLPKRGSSFWFFLPRPSDGSACKRLNLFLRWMVGKTPMDLSLWTSISTSQLAIPLDVHVLKQARALRFTRRKQADWTAVEEVTASLRLLDPEDPVRFDFALCHLGMKGRILSRL